jgi:hypothetical protein
VFADLAAAVAGGADCIDGVAIAPLRDWDAQDFTFTDEEIEILARAEHERWNRERLADGWTLGAKRNVELKRTPYLVAFDELPPDIADYDRILVREIPAALAAVGLQVIRLTAAVPARVDDQTGVPSRGAPPAGADTADRSE